MTKNLYPFLFLSVTACANAPANAQEAGAARPARAPATAPPSIATSSVLSACLAEEEVGGVIAVRTSDREWCSDVERCAMRFTPASTFKIPNSLIALETGVATGSEHMRPFDGVPRWNEAWNRDHTLRSAFRESVVWYYQEVAREVGPARMQHWVDAFDYGNRSIAGDIDHFWIEGDLTISPLEQVRFLERLNDHDLPVSDRTRGVVLDIMELSRDAEGVLRGKTGTAFAETDDALFWFVGFYEGRGAPLYFATLVQGRVTDRNARRRVTDCVIERFHGV